MFWCTVCLCSCSRLCRCLSSVFVLSSVVGFVVGCVCVFVLVE